jgi:hypothetical protein
LRRAANRLAFRHAPRAVLSVPPASSTTILQSPWMQRVFLIAVLSAVIFNMTTRGAPL